MSSAAPASARNKPRSTRINVVSNWISYATAILIGFFLSPFVVHRLGDAAYGVWTLLASLVGYMGLLDLGIQSAVRRYVAAYHTAEDDKAASSTVSTALVMFLFLGMIAVALSLLAGAFGQTVFDVPQDLLHTVRPVFFIGGLSVGVSLVSGVFGGTITALQRFDLSAGLEISVNLIRTAGIVVLLLAGYGLLAVALMQLGANVLRFGLNWWVANSIYPGLRVKPGLWERSRLAQLFSFSVYASILHLSQTIQWGTASLVIGAFLPVQMVTYYAIAANLRMYAVRLVSGIAHAAGPRVSALEAKGEFDELCAFVLRSCSFATLVTLPITITYFIRGGTFIRLWMGDTYTHISGEILAILAVAVTFSAARHVTGTALMSVSEHKNAVPFQLLEATLNVILCIFWISELGLVGVPLGIVIPSVVTSGIVMPQLAARYLGIPLRRFYTQAWIRPIMAMLPFALITWLIENWSNPESLFTFFIQVVLALPAAAVGFWLAGFTSISRLRIERLS